MSPTEFHSYSTVHEISPMTVYPMLPNCRALLITYSKHNLRKGVVGIFVYLQFQPLKAFLRVVKETVNTLNIYFNNISFYIKLFHFWYDKQNYDRKRFTLLTIFILRVH
jgi:hypothetical protein